MKSLLKEFVAYHLWANQQLTGCILLLDADTWIKPVDSSFPSLHKTVLHMWDADAIWWQRIKGEKDIKVPSGYFKDAMPQLVQQLLLQDEAWYSWVNGFDDNELGKPFRYANSRGEQFEQPLADLLLHICNHGTYHRGQLVTMLRSLAVKNIPQTDFIHWARTNKQ